MAAIGLDALRQLLDDVFNECVTLSAVKNGAPAMMAERLCARKERSTQTVDLADL